MLMRMFIVYLLLVVTASPARADFTIPNVADAFNTAQAQVDSGDLAIVVMGMKGTGVVTGCAVTAQGTPDMTVAVASGTIRVAQTDATVTSGNVTITTADGTNPRFDLVVVNSSGTKSVTAGTPAANPVYPAIPASSVVLATVYVPASDTTIATNQITDKRVIVPSILLANVIQLVPVIINAGNSPYAPTTTDLILLCDTTAAGRTISLPAATRKILYRIKNLGTNSCTINRAGSDTIDGGTSAVLTTQYEAIDLASDGISAWSIL